MGFSQSDKHQTTTSLFSNIVDAASGSFTESLTISGTPVTGRDLYTLLEDQKSSGTSGGTFDSGAWRTRDLNTIVTNEAGATLSSNQFTLPAGTYTVHIHLPSLRVSEVKGRLQNITDVSTVFFGASSFGSLTGSVTPPSRADLIFGRFTITATKTFEVQHRCSVTKTVNGFGPGNGNFGDNETYTQVEIWKHV